jgi:hypothetical protein
MHPLNIFINNFGPFSSEQEAQSLFEQSYMGEYASEEAFLEENFDLEDESLSFALAFQNYEAIDGHLFAKL